MPPVEAYNTPMKVSRRNTLRLLAAAAAASRSVPAQPPPPVTAQQIEAARADLRDSIQRIARVNLPRTVEPAFTFRA